MPACAGMTRGSLSKVETKRLVIPAKAGIQVNQSTFLDPSVRWHDEGSLSKVEAKGSSFQRKLESRSIKCIPGCRRETGMTVLSELHESRSQSARTENFDCQVNRMKWRVF